MKKDEIKQKRPFAPGIQWQLMLFIGGITLFTLLLVWGIITYALEPQYNRNIRAKLDSKATAITALIDQSDAEISSRTYQGLYLNDEFWSGVSQTFRDKKINVDGNCVDFSDSTLRCLKAYESMYPCLLHESTGAFGGEFGYNLDTRIAIQLRQKLFQDGSLYQIVKIGSSMQMCVGRLSADGQYGVIVSASLAQITTAAEVLRAILGPVALILLVLDLLLAILFSRCSRTRSASCPTAHRRLPPATTMCRSRLNATMRSDVWPRISTTWPPRSSAAPSSKRTFWRTSATTCAPR